MDRVSALEKNRAQAIVAGDFDEHAPVDEKVEGVGPEAALRN